MTSKKKIAASIGAVGMAAVIALGGTFAWQSISQQALNETMKTINPGGRLHDDFNGQNKNVYVENFTEDGTAIFARVRLDEYMEIGEGAGTDGDGNKATSLVEEATREDKTSWTTRLPGENETFGAYWDWNMGGQSVYMPTFNKNKDSLQADVNGTYDGTIPDDDTHYDDYKEYEEGAELTADAYYDADTNDVDEGNTPEAVEAGNVTTKNEMHTAALTETATVITMAEWIEDGMQTGPYWVWDTDGWAYWAQPIKSGETTGLLLDEIVHTNPPSDSWYYGINVVGQFVTADDIGFLNNTGFYDKSKGEVPTAAAEVLLETITGTDIPNTTVTVTANGNAETVTAGETLQFNFAVADKEGSPVSEATVTWSVSGALQSGTSIAENGLLTVDSSESAETELTVTATYTKDGVPYTGAATVKVAPAG